METLDINEISEDSELSSSSNACPDCNEPNNYYWCQQCNAKRFQRDFHKWTSGNKFIDKFIQESQLNAKRTYYILEWIPYNRLTNVKYLDKGGFSTVYKAIWLDGSIDKWDYENSQWKRFTYKIDIDSDEDDNNISKIEGREVVLKSLDNSSSLNYEFLNEVIILLL